MYLQQNQNWIFRLLKNLPETEVIIASRQFLPCPYYSEAFEYIRAPFQTSLPAKGPWWLRQVNKGVKRVLRLYPWYVSKVAREIDIVHSHFAHVGWDYLALAPRLSAPHVVSFYGYDYESLPAMEPVWKDRYRILFQKADVFVCEGRHGARVLEQQGCPSQKIRVCPLGVETRNTRPARRSKQPGSLELIQIAALTGKKGHVYTVRAFLRARPSCPDLRLTLVGSAKEAEGQEIAAELRNLVRTAGAGDFVTFIDSIAFADLYDLLSRYHVFIHPSVYTESRDCEGGAPVVILDAQATGMPVISTTHCDIPDEVEDGRTGLLAPERDVGRLAGLIERFYWMGDEEYQSFCEAAREHVEREYDIRTNAGRLREVYRDAVEHRAPRKH
jgi:colanic acid/amylovoran biosynthesis glycosyltransferase